MMDDLFDVRELFSRRGFMICFVGPFSHRVIEELGKAVRNYLSVEKAPDSKIADIFSVFIEQAQNLKNYTESPALGVDDPIRSGIVVIGKENEKIVVRSGNLIVNSDVPVLEARLTELSNLDKDALKILYKKRMREAPDLARGGAGLGLIEMARRSAEPLQWSFREVDAATSFFSLSARL